MKAKKEKEEINRKKMASTMKAVSPDLASPLASQ